MSATHRGSTRAAQDLYETPVWCVDLILSRIRSETVSGSLEPCRASGRIYDRLPGHDRYYSELSEGLDYLTLDFSGFDLDLIVTNPPFSLALPFVEKSLSEAETIAYLLRLNFLGSQSRKEFWARCSLTHLYVLSRRPSFINGRTDATEYAWFVWDRSEGGRRMVDPPGVYVL